jgi:hypothetical protein
MKPLAFMTKLSPCVYVYRPAPVSPAPAALDSSSAAKANPPKLILLATWMGARDLHIAKYLVQYQALYPSSPILLLRSEPRHFLRPRRAPGEFAPAVPFVRAIFPDLGREIDTNKTDTPQPQLLIHVWSNGGASSLRNLRLALAVALNNNNNNNNKRGAPTRAALPPHTLLLDSAPGTFRYRAGYRAFTAGLKGPALWLAAPLMHALCAWYWFAHVLVGRGRTGPLAALAAGLNETDGGNNAGAGKEEGAGAVTSEVRRTYLYGPADALVDWRDVEAHAVWAERKGFRVRRERFEGGAHVAHVRVDPERYWRVARETWEGRK